MGLIAENSHSIAPAYVVPLAAYVFIAAYAFVGAKARLPAQLANAR
jgi:fucose permease